MACAPVRPVHMPFEVIGLSLSYSIQALLTVLSMYIQLPPISGITLSIPSLKGQARLYFQGITIFPSSSIYPHFLSFLITANPSDEMDKIFHLLVSCFVFADSRALNSYYLPIWCNMVLYIAILRLSNKHFFIAYYIYPCGHLKYIFWSNVGF